ncbi:MAG: ribosome-associated translation inhibitor RaiA, partial [Pseudomonadota bacterium]
TAGVAKYFDRSVDAHVTFTREGHGFRCETSVHLSSGITMQSHAEAGEIYAAFESATERLEKRLRRYKRRLKDHHNRAKEPVSQVAASAYVIQAEAAQAEVSEPEDLTPIIIAETTADVKTLTVGEAVMQMDLQEAPALLFHNVAHGGLNMVYRRPDGHIGWIDPNEQSG